ncbi:MAG: hypothetical protein QXM75_04600, partial [Candidatus Diapherotrites archaeon]
VGGDNMIIRKKALLFFILFLIFSNVSSLSINVPENVPEGTSFAAFTNISETGFDEIRVLLDGKVVFTQKLGVEANTEYIAYYKEYSPTGDKRLVLIFNPLKAGKYDLEVRLISGNSTKSKDSVTINVFKVASTSYVDSVIRELNSLKADLNALKSEIKALNEKIESLETKTNNLNTELISTKEVLQSTLSSLQEIEQKIASTNESLSLQTTSLSETKANLQDLNTQLLALIQRVENVETKVEDNKAPAVGFFTLETNTALLTLALVLVIVVIVVYIAKKNKTRTSLFETDIYDKNKNPDEVLEDVMEESLQTKGRWAYKEPSQKEEKESKHFGLGDLIKR